MKGRISAGKVPAVLSALFLIYGLCTVSYALNVSLVTFICIPETETGESTEIRVEIRNGETDEKREFSLYACNGFCAKKALPDGTYGILSVQTENGELHVPPEERKFTVSGPTDCVFRAGEENGDVGDDGGKTDENRAETVAKRFELGKIGERAGKAALAVTCVSAASAACFIAVRKGRGEVKHAGRKKRKQKNIRKGKA